MKYLAAFVAVLALAVTAHCSPECKWGASYWCQSISTAQQCGRVQYCKDNFWKNERAGVVLLKGTVETSEKPATPSIDTCSICKLIVQFVDNFIDTNQTEAEAEAALEEICKYLGGFATECKDLVDTFFPTIWKELVAETSPDTLCTLLKLCNDSQVKQSSDACDLCKLIVGFIDKEIENNKTESEVKAELKDLCSRLGSLSSECDFLVDMYFPDIWKYLMNETDPDKICTELHLCTSSLKKKAQTSPVGCTICKFIVGYIDQLMDKNSTEDEVEGILKDLCSHLGSLQAECDDIVDKYFPAIWQLLLKELDPDTICTLLDLCTSSQTRPKVTDIPCELCEFLTKLVNNELKKNTSRQLAREAADEICYILGPFEQACFAWVQDHFDAVWNALLNDTDPTTICTDLLHLCSSEAAAPKQDLCSLCELVVGFIKPYVESKATEEEVEEALEKLCDILPGAYKNECNSLVTEFFPDIWEMLQKEFNQSAKDVCEVLGLCTSTRQPRPAVSQPKADLCQVCELVAQFLQKFVDSNATEAEVETALKNFCGLLPSEFKAECDGLVQDYFPMLWELVQSYVDNPEETCKLLGLCKNETLPLVTVKMPQQDACDICQLIVSFLKPFVDSNSTETEVEDALEKFCDLLPSEFKDKCTDAVENYFPLIWALMKTYADDPKELCTLIGLCSGTSAKVPRRVEVGGTLCNLCELVVKFVDTYVTSNKTEQEAKDRLEELCTFLPLPYGDDCDKLIEKYLPEIWGMVQKEVNDVCEQLGLCNSSVVKPVPSVKAPKLILCVICEWVMKELDSMLDSNATKAEIEAALDKVCDLLPSTIKEDCDNFVAKYAPAIIDLLLQKLAPNLVCTVLGLCAGDATKPSLDVGDDCSLCTLVLSYLKTILNSTQTDVEKALEIVCNFLPKTIRAECDAFVEEYGPAIIQLVIKDINPKAICTDLGLCSSSVRAHISPLMQPWVKLLPPK